jgi:hypothetical protein
VAWGAGPPGLPDQISTATDDEIFAFIDNQF